MLFLHANLNDSTLEEALARLGRNPKILRCDNAGPYHDEKTKQICLSRGIHQQFSNANQQFQNAPAETSVNGLGNGVRVQLVDANLKGTFWGYAAINYIDCYNHLPQARLGNKTPWEVEKGTKPNVSWFKPFGCQATVYIGDTEDFMWHHKLAARGVACIYVGLGFSRGQKGWICYDPDAKVVYCTRNVVFDETFFPMRTHDQRVLGHYDSTPRTRMIHKEYGSLDAAEQNQNDLDNIAASRLLESIDAADDWEKEDIRTPPCGREAHDEADPLVKDTGSDDS